MHERRNFGLVIGALASFIWLIFAWVFAGDSAALWWHRAGSSAAFLVLSGGLLYALKFEDKLPDYLREMVGEIYYDADGLSFMPAVRHRNGRAELCLYYQNRFEGPVQAIVHLRPPDESFAVRDGMRDMHFAFTAGGGDFGAIHLPIAVPRHLQGDVVNVSLAAATFYPRSHGSRLRRHDGMPCGTLPVDWAGSAFKTGVHEVSNELTLHAPATLHLSMPRNVNEAIDPRATWRQERLATAETT